MPRKNESWGIEVGQNAIKAVRLTKHGSDVHLEDYEVVRFKQILSTPDLDVDEQVQLYLDKLIQKHDLTNANTVISVPGHLAFARFAKLPPVEPKKIPDIVKFEAVQQIPFPIEQVEWDYQVFQQEDSPDVEVGIFAITKERVAHFLANYRAMNIRVDALTLSPLAVYNAFAFDNDGDDGVMYMDIGTVSTDVIIVENGGIWLRTLPIGGNAFTEALVRAFKISYPKAEKLKREAATSKYAKQIFQAMRGVFADLVQEVQRSLGYYQSLNRDADVTKLIGVGSTFKLPGLSKFLKQQLQLDVVRPDGFNKISVEGKREADFAEHAINLATAYGLAVQGLGMQAVEANILPTSVLTSRMWKAKQPWLLAGAACVAVAAGLMGASYFSARSTWSSAYDKDGNSGTDIAVKRVTGAAGRLNNEMESIGRGEDPRQRIANLRGALDYRELWPLIQEDIAGAIASLNSDQALFGRDATAVKAIPRNERRRLYIQSIDTQYRVRTGGGSNTGADATGGMPAAASTGGDRTVNTFFNPTSKTAPSIRVTVIGTTPYNTPRESTEAMLEATFERYLLQNANRPDRPYTLDLSDGGVTYLTSVTSAGPGAGAGGVGPSAGPSVGTRPGRPGFQPPIHAEMPGGGTQPLDLKSIDALLPSDPLVDEPRNKDYEFRIEWEVVLKEPVESRPDVQSPAPTGGPQQPSASAPQTPQADAASDALTTDETEARS